MAKKPKVSGRGYAVFMIGIIAFVIMEPVVLFGAVFYFVWKMYQIKLSGETDYWLSKDEKEYFLSALGKQIMSKFDTLNVEYVRERE